MINISYVRQLYASLEKAKKQAICRLLVSLFYKPMEFTALDT
ncbi:hypothetical protein MY9_4137 [Bacillus sp. JS]|nr:hypothetical protein MY9_4137 [Bacillus sp. JS]